MDMERVRQLGSLLDEIVEERERLARDKAQAARMEEILGAYSLLGAYDFSERERALARKLADYEDDVQGLRAWIDTIRDSMTRRACRLRFFDRLTWTAIAFRMGYATEAGPRMLVMREISRREKVRS